MIDFTNEQGKHELLPISKLVLNDGRIQGVPKNPRRPRTDTSVEDLAQSVQDTPEMLFPRPLIVFLWEDKYVVVGGNMRLRACKHLKVKNVPCYVLHPDTPVPTLKAIALKDNGGFGVFDFGEDLGDWGDIDASFGIDGAVFGEGEETDEYGQVDDYSDKNKELEFGEEDNKMKIVLEYTFDDYQLVRDALAKVAHTPEQAVWKLLKL